MLAQHAILTLPVTARRPLGVAAWVPLSPRQLEQLAAIEAYNLDFVRDRLEDKALVAPERLDQAIYQFRRYLGLVAAGISPARMFSDEADEVWHQFILFTRAYGEFCEAVFGRFVHHQPSQRSDAPEAEGARLTVEDYVYVYGEVFPD